MDVEDDAKLRQTTLILILLHTTNAVCQHVDEADVVIHTQPYVKASGKWMMSAGRSTTHLYLFAAVHDGEQRECSECCRTAR